MEDVVTYELDYSKDKCIKIVGHFNSKQLESLSQEELFKVNTLISKMLLKKVIPPVENIYDKETFETFVRECCVQLNGATLTKACNVWKDVMKELPDTFRFPQLIEARYAYMCYNMVLPGTIEHECLTNADIIKAVFQKLEEDHYVEKSGLEITKITRKEESTKRRTMFDF